MKFKRVKTFRSTFILIILFAIIGCSGKQNMYRTLNEEFKQYWFDGMAEVTSYELRQARYGEIWDGNAVIIFVSEPFSREKQVKLDNPSEDGINVLKMNFMRKFTTGIYPYSTMISTFSPLTEYTQTALLKETFSAQEWCGQVFTQLNRKGDAFELSSYSYFEKEGDERKVFPVVFTEDEIWSRIRFSLDELPVGNFQILPDVMAARLGHFSLEPVNAEAQLEMNDSTAEYTLIYPGGRELMITFEKEFPRRILKWTEKVGELETTAVRKKVFKIPYWKLNKKSDLIWRDSLDLN